MQTTRKPSDEIAPSADAATAKVGLPPVAEKLCASARDARDDRKRSLENIVGKRTTGIHENDGVATRQEDGEHGQRQQENTGSGSTSVWRLASSSASGNGATPEGVPEAEDVLAVKSAVSAAAHCGDVTGMDSAEDKDLQLRGFAEPEHCTAGDDSPVRPVSPPISTSGSPDPQSDRQNGLRSRDSSHGEEAHSLEYNGSTAASNAAASNAAARSGGSLLEPVGTLAGKKKQEEPPAAPVERWVPPGEQEPSVAAESPAPEATDIYQLEGKAGAEDAPPHGVQNSALAAARGAQRAQQSGASYRKRQQGPGAYFVAPFVPRARPAVRAAQQTQAQESIPADVDEEGSSQGPDKLSDETTPPLGRRVSAALRSAYSILAAITPSGRPRPPPRQGDDGVSHAAVGWIRRRSSVGSTADHEASPGETEDSEARETAGVSAARRKVLPTAISWWGAVSSSAPIQEKTTSRVTATLSMDATERATLTSEAERWGRRFSAVNTRAPHALGGGPAVNPYRRSHHTERFADTQLQLVPKKR